MILFYFALILAGIRVIMITWEFLITLDGGILGHLLAESIIFSALFWVYLRRELLQS